MKNTFYFHPDIDTLEVAVSQIRKVATYINEQKRIYEQKHMEAELQIAIGKKYQKV